MTIFQDSIWRIDMGMGSLASACVFAMDQFSGAQLGDARRSKRLVKVAEALATEPRGTLHGAIKDPAGLAAAYRLLGSDAATLKSVTAPHRQNVFDACRAPGDVLLIEDTTTLNYSTLQHVEGLGWIGDDEACKGVHLHSTLAVRIDGWNPNHEPQLTLLGLFALHGWTRTYAKRGQGSEKKSKRFMRERESQRWAATFGPCEGPPAGTRWTYVADRESDIFEVFQQCRAKDVDWIVRANQPRALADDGGSVFDAAARAPRRGQYTLKLRARPGQKRRKAKLEVRAATVLLRGPQRPGGRLEPERLNVVEVREIDPPEGVEAIHWVLLTSWPCESLAEMLRVVKSYARRWLIEEFHKALKTGVGAEDSQLTSARSLQALIGILSVVALRLLNLKLLSRTHPDGKVQPEEIGAEALALLEKAYRKPPDGWTNQTVLISIARMGGFLARKGDGPPGWRILWQGWHRLMTMAEGIRLLLGT
jgi:transposase-like protein/DDE family transposase